MSWAPSPPSPELARRIRALFRRGLSDEQIGAELGRSRWTIRHDRHALRLLRVPTPAQRVDRARLRELHADGLSTPELATELGCTYRTAQELLHREGLRAHR